ncbi:hypothetical protein [Phyllobacterium phragmitis]|nr:hypothetical protein [Phyllobacterium phragmitis]
MNRESDPMSRPVANSLRDEFGMARAILEYSLRENIAGFTLSGLKIPRILQTWRPGSELPPADEFALEVAIYQEHLGDRIAALSCNRKMLQEIWRFNEATREFRELELTIPEAAREVLDQLANLVNALFDQDRSAAIRSLAHCQNRRYDLVEEIAHKLSPPEAMHA